MPIRLPRRRLLSAAMLAWLASPLVASANVEWCFDDPPVLVRLPSGAPMNVTVRLSVPNGARPQLRAAGVSAAARDVDGQAVVDLSVLIPSGPSGAFPVLVTAAARKDQVQVTGQGLSGQLLTLTLLLPPR